MFRTEGGKFYDEYSDNHDGSILTARWLNAVQENICRLIESSGREVPNASDDFDENVNHDSLKTAVHSIVNKYLAEYKSITDERLGTFAKNLENFQELLNNIHNTIEKINKDMAVLNTFKYHTETALTNNKTQLDAYNEVFCLQKTGQHTQSTLAIKVNVKIFGSVTADGPIIDTYRDHIKPLPKPDELADGN